MKPFILNLATSMLVVGYLLWAVHFAIVHTPRMSIAMVLFAAAMYFLFI